MPKPFNMDGRTIAGGSTAGSLPRLFRLAVARTPLYVASCVVAITVVALSAMSPCIQVVEGAHHQRHVRLHDPLLATHPDPGHESHHTAPGFRLLDEHRPSHSGAADGNSSSHNGSSGGSSGSGSGACENTSCDAATCAQVMCGWATPFRCTTPMADGGGVQCLTAEPPTGACASCCNVQTCGTQSCNETCDAATCLWAAGRCPAAAPVLCASGISRGGCSATPSTWVQDTTCGACCNVTSCAPAPPTNTSCPPCSLAVCKTAGSCPLADPFHCLAGAAKGGCLSASEIDNGACTSCCDTASCGPAPTAGPTVTHPPSPWMAVPPSKNCTTGGLPAYSPNPNRTRAGAKDVSGAGCRAWVSEDCCGLVPRFNWIISSCSSDPANRTSMACTHKGASNSALDLYYVAAYQWNGTHWVNDVESSTPVSLEGHLDLSPYQLASAYGLQDWDVKYAPTTQKHHTDGVGPGAMMFVLSAKRFGWSAFFALNQITINRGPGGQVMADNCWSSSSGELDFIEVPFWADIDLPLDRFYTTTTADSGRCLPTQKSIPPVFASYCTNGLCCEMCSCPNGTVCFGDASNIAFSPMGCIAANETVPSGFTTFDVLGSNTTCGEYFGAVAGGAQSTAYFQAQSNEGDTDVMYAVVVDRDGTFVYRWFHNETGDAGSPDVDQPAAEHSSRARSHGKKSPRPHSPKSSHGRTRATDAGGSDSDSRAVWPGLSRTAYAPVLEVARPTRAQMKLQAPCADPTAACGVFEPACGGECPLVAAAGTFGLDQVSGAYAAEAARDDLNWWNLFDRTGQLDTTLTSPAALPKYVHVKTIVPALPFYCNASCGEALCAAPNRCGDAAPYMCTRGDGYMGCNAQYTFWPLSQHCDACCDVKLCDFQCTMCPSDMCVDPVCPVQVPYQCTSGAASGQCSASASFWGKQPVCDSCCYCPP